MLLKDDRRRELLVEMTDSTLRIWLIFLALYGKASVKRFLNYTQNDNAGIAFKCPRVIRSRIDYLNGLSSASADPLQHTDFVELRVFVTARPAVYGVALTLAHT